MATNEETKDQPTDDAPEEKPEAAQEEASASTAMEKADEEPAAHEEEAQIEGAAPTQLGTRRFVYAAYFAGAIGVAFLASKVVEFAWFRLSNWKPQQFGDPSNHQEIVMLLAAAIGIGAAIYYWYRTRARKLAEEVATELSKVTWPGRTEVINSTFITIVTTLIATTFFALMDRFWGFLTNLVYGT